MVKNYYFKEQSIALDFKADTIGGTFAETPKEKLNVTERIMAASDNRDFIEELVKENNLELILYLAIYGFIRASEEVINKHSSTEGSHEKE